MADGVLDVSVLPKPTAALVSRLLPRLYTGGLGEDPAVVRVRASRVRVDTPIVAEADGEPIRGGPFEITVLPRALQARGGWLQPPRGPASTAA